jgi:tetratricopeptide (TPR) repeat protein
LADSCLISLFLVLTFLLGAFPLKDADFYWHLRTGDLIRQTWQIPRTDIYTFTREGAPWIDLHWVFQITISWLYAHAGVVGLSLAKCAVTCIAVFLLVTARRKEWPVWAVLLAWLPALLVLSGRMYVRPETLTLLYLSIFLAVVTRWDHLPSLALVLPLVQVAWVNTHGLFVLGPIVLILALLEAVLRKGTFGPGRKAWWRTVLLASLGTAVACLINPYGLSGALYPLELAATMSNPVFARSVAELMSVREFIERAGWFNLPLQLHLGTAVLGALSFLLPLAWLAATHFSRAGSTRTPGGVEGQGEGHKSAGAGRKSRSRSNAGTTNVTRKGRTMPTPAGQASAWRLSLFRLVLYGVFCALSLRATRNTHQFAAIVGSVTAWNFAEWAAAVQHRRASILGLGRARRATLPRLAACGAILLVILWVGTGWFYSQAGEGRTIGLGEEPLWFPHEAARFAGKPGMPDRFLSFHNAHASLFEYYHGPGRKVYTDPRLEVAGADLFKHYIELEKRLASGEPGWEAELDALARPVILVDHQRNSAIGATLLQSAHWRCVWFDAIAGVFVHDSFREVVRSDAIDFAARHFRPTAATEPAGAVELKASAGALRNYVAEISPTRPDLARPLVWLGIGYARRILRENPGSIEGLKALGQIELLRNPPVQAGPRFRASFDPVLDLSQVRATYALRRGLEVAPYDPLMLLLLRIAYDSRDMSEAALDVINTMAAIRPSNEYQRDQRSKAITNRPDYQRRIGPALPTTWRNLSELDQIVTAQLAAGRAASAAELLERATPPQRASWQIVDLMATLRLHLGEPAQARRLWEQASSVKDPGLRDSRIAATYLVQGDFEAARHSYQQALEASPDLFEAHYSLAVLEQDDGHSQAAYDAARRAMKTATDEAGRAAARTLASSVARFAGREATPSKAD